MATKKKLKYEENKKIALVFNVNEYNDIGIDNDEVAAKGTGVYKTRKLDAHIKDTTQPLRIDQARPVTKKKIAVPETKNDDNYYPFIDFKRAHVETVNQTRGYKRAFLDDHLPNPEAYTCSEEDLKLLAELNASLSLSNPSHPQHVRDEDFQVIIQIWESEVGRAVMLEKKKNGSAAPETNRLPLDRAKHLLKEFKEKETGLGLAKHSQFNKVVEKIYEVLSPHAVLGHQARRAQPPLPAEVLEQLHPTRPQAPEESFPRAAERGAHEDEEQRGEADRPRHPGEGTPGSGSSTSSRKTSNSRCV